MQPQQIFSFNGQYIPQQLNLEMVAQQLKAIDHQTKLPKPVPGQFDRETYVIDFITSTLPTDFKQKILQAMATQSLVPAALMTTLNRDNKCFNNSMGLEPDTRKMVSGFPESLARYLQSSFAKC